MKKSELAQMSPVVNITKHIWSYHFVNFNVVFSYNVVTHMMSFFVNGVRVSHISLGGDFTSIHFKILCKNQFVRFMNLGMRMN